MSDPIPDWNPDAQPASSPRRVNVKRLLVWVVIVVLAILAVSSLDMLF